MRLDFIERPSGTGYLVVLNGRQVPDRFDHVSEVLAFAHALGTAARYCGTAPNRIVAEGGNLQAGDEDFVC
jgi:hypothetical protein